MEGLATLKCPSDVAGLIKTVLRGLGENKIVPMEVIRDALRCTTHDWECMIAQVGGMKGAENITWLIAARFVSARAPRRLLMFVLNPNTCIVMLPPYI